MTIADGVEHRGLESPPWQAASYNQAQATLLAQELQLHPILAALLCIREQSELAAAKNFIQPSLAGLHDPERIPDMLPAVERIALAIEQSELICIYGDYDVDGLSSTALLVAMFEQFGLAVETYVPNRLVEGYGLNCEAIQQIANCGVQLLITVDGGSNDHQEIALARELGMEVLVTDHHPIHSGLPADTLVVHPGRPGESGESSSLAGVGVAYKLVWALGRHLAGEQRVDDDYREFMLTALAYVALGTVADVVPLLQENRVLVHYGLRALENCQLPGLTALCEHAKVEAPIDAEAVAFRMAPMLNAAGRLGEAGKALQLLLSEDPEEADPLAAELLGFNRKRKDIERKMLESSIELIEQRGDHRISRQLPIVVWSEDWHSGVAGIVASRLVERYHRPAFVMAVQDGLGRGSARCPDGMTLLPFYEAGRQIVQSIGGHKQAGGLAIAADQLEAFREALTCEDLLPSLSAKETTRRYDLDLDLKEVDLHFVHRLQKLAPFGHRNPLPRFRLSALRVDGELRLVGQGEDHLMFTIIQDRRRFKAIYFRGAEHARWLRSQRHDFSAIVELAINDFRNTQSVELRIIAFDGLEAKLLRT